MVLFAALWHLQGAARVENGEGKSRWLKDGNNSLSAALLERRSGRDWWHGTAPGWQGWHIPPGRWKGEGNSHLSRIVQTPGRCRNTAEELRWGQEDEGGSTGVSVAGCELWDRDPNELQGTFEEENANFGNAGVSRPAEGAVMKHSHCQGHYSIWSPGAESSGCSGCHNSPMSPQGTPGIPGIRSCCRRWLHQLGPLGSSRY